MEYAEQDLYVSLENVTADNLFALIDECMKNRQNIVDKLSETRKKLEAAASENTEAAMKLYPETVSAIDAAVTKGVLHKNNANNRKAKLALKINALN